MNTTGGYYKIFAEADNVSTSVPLGKTLDEIRADIEASNNTLIPMLVLSLPSVSFQGTVTSMMCYSIIESIYPWSYKWNDEITYPSYLTIDMDGPMPYVITEDGVLMDMYSYEQSLNSEEEEEKP